MLDRRATLALGAATLGTAVAFERGSALAQAPQAASSPGQPPAQPTASPAPPYRPHTVRTPDGLSIQAYEYGNPNGPAILLIHGYAQSALSWERQTRDPDLAREFRMVAYDVRGHGMSDKPTGDQYYKPSKPWSDEVRAVIEQTGLVNSHPTWPVRFPGTFPVTMPLGLLPPQFCTRSGARLPRLVIRSGNLRRITMLRHSQKRKLHL